MNVYVWEPEKETDDMGITTVKQGIPSVVIQNLCEESGRIRKNCEGVWRVRSPLLGSHKIW
jgi:hypothetical protein